MARRFRLVCRTDLAPVRPPCSVVVRVQPWIATQPHVCGGKLDAHMHAWHHAPRQGGRGYTLHGSLAISRLAMRCAPGPLNASCVATLAPLCANMRNIFRDAVLRPGAPGPLLLCLVAFCMGWEMPDLGPA